MQTEGLNEKAKAELKAIEDAAFDRGKAEGLRVEGDRRVELINAAVVHAKAQAAQAERERIQAVEAAGAGMPAHDKLVQELKYDGQTTAAQAAEKILAAEKTTREARLATIRAEAPKPVPHAPVPAAPAGQESDYNPAEVAAKARHYRLEMDQKGVKVSAREATDHVLAEGGFKVGTEPMTPGA